MPWQLQVLGSSKCRVIFVLQLNTSLTGAAALAAYLSPGTTEIHFIDLVLNLFVAIQIDADLKPYADIEQSC